MNYDVLSNLVITKFELSATMYNDVNEKTKRTCRDRWGIVIKYEGESEYEANGIRYVSNKNNMVILPKGCSYEWHCTKAGHFSIIEFDSDSTCDRIFPFSVKDGDRFLKSFKELEYKQAKKGPMYKAECIRDCYNIILKLTQGESKQYSTGAVQKKIAPAIDHIIKNYNRSITNDELASLTGFSTVYFRKLFYKVYGTSPIAYLHDLRIKKAKEMLKSDYGSISDIAKSLGYLNIYDFSRDFKKHTGVPPTRY